jgi:hypothetical protein
VAFNEHNTYTTQQHVQDHRQGAKQDTKQVQYWQKATTVQKILFEIFSDNWLRCHHKYLFSSL